MKLKKAICYTAIVFALAGTFSVSCLAKESVNEQYSSIVENSEEAPFVTQWAIIQTTSGDVGVPAGTYVPGASSYYVRLAQASLNALGYNCGSADGIYGTNTKNAIIRFQRDNGIAADGIVGDKTWTVLQRMLYSNGVYAVFQR